MPKKKINPMTQDQMLNIPYQFDMVPASKAVGPSGDVPARDSSSSLMKIGRPAERSDVTEAQRVGKARARSEKASEELASTAKDWLDFSPSGIGKKSNVDLSFAAAKAYLAKKNKDAAEEQQGYKKGGMVRGCGMAARGHGKGRMC